jgi:hypothetical protein
MLNDVLLEKLRCSSEKDLLHQLKEYDFTHQKNICKNQHIHAKPGHHALMAWFCCKYSAVCRTSSAVKVLVDEGLSKIQSGMFGGGMGLFDDGVAGSILSSVGVEGG